MYWKAHDRYSKDMIEMRQRQGVRSYRTPRNVLDAQLKAWDTVIAALSSDAYFKKVIDSQRAWGRRVTSFFLENEAPSQIAYNHFFGQRQAPAQPAQGRG